MKQHESVTRRHQISMKQDPSWYRITLASSALSRFFPIVFCSERWSPWRSPCHLHYRYHRHLDRRRKRHSPLRLVGWACPQRLQPSPLKRGACFFGRSYRCDSCALPEELLRPVSSILCCRSVGANERRKIRKKSLNERGGRTRRKGSCLCKVCSSAFHLPWRSFGGCVRTKPKQRWPLLPPSSS